QLRATSQTASSPTVTTPLLIAPPPIVLVHGVWSSADDAWGGASGLKAYLTGLGFFIFNESLANYGSLAESFDPGDENSPVIDSMIDAAYWSRFWMEADGWSVAQVDVIAHSQGGLVARARVARTADPYQNRGNYWRGDFHK